MPIIVAAVVTSGSRQGYKSKTVPPDSRRSDQHIIECAESETASDALLVSPMGPDGLDWGANGHRAIIAVAGEISQASSQAQDGPLDGRAVY